ncbi:MAG: DUF3106 domain-containing protein [Rhodoferax sp.]|nr:DUF3106 domain-containing protein [Rhodoferax sp.]
MQVSVFFSYATLALGLLSGIEPAAAQANPPSKPVVHAPVPVTAVVRTNGPIWTELTKPQRDALGPLAKAWNSLSEAHKLKWLSIAQSYPTLSSDSQLKLQARMVEWAALTPRDRELARLNFAETKKVAPADRAAGWEAYQALSPEERRKLAAQATKVPLGAAIATKPAPPSKLAAVPVTRHTPQNVRLEATSKQGVNPNTLLPQPVAATPATTQPAAPEPEPALEPERAPESPS